MLATVSDACLSDFNDENVKINVFAWLHESICMCDSQSFWLAGHTLSLSLSALCSLSRARPTTSLSLLGALWALCSQINECNVIQLAN